MKEKDETQKRGRKPKKDRGAVVKKLVGVFFSENQIEAAGGRRPIQEALNKAAEPFKS